MDADTATPRSNNSAKSFNWSAEQEGWLLSSFFIGYIFTQFPGGLLAQWLGGKWVFGIGVGMTSLLTLLTPLAAFTNVWVLMALRVLEGIFEGVSFPAMHVIWSHWAPPQERSILTAISYSGSYVGNVVSFPVSALLCWYGFAGGWPSVFYVFGTVGVCWFLLWALLAGSTPSSHRFISASERDYIECSVAVCKSEERHTPWRRLLLSPHVWAIAVAHFCNNWGVYTLMTCMPTFLANIGVLPGTEAVVLNGVYSGIPYAMMAGVALSAGAVADCLRKRVSTTVVRKAFTTASFTLSSVFLLLCVYYGTSATIAVTLLTLGVGCGGLSLAGFNINHLDIAPRYAGVLMALTNTAGTLPGIVGPLVAKAIALPPSAPKGSAEYIATYRSEWSEVFLLCVEIYMFGALIYLILGSGKKQPWADDNEPTVVN
eukprot:Em0005g1680a